MSHGKMKLEQHKSDNAAQVIQVDDSAKECAKSKTAAFLSKNNDSVIRVKYRFVTTVLDRLCRKVLRLFAPLAVF